MKKINIAIIGGSGLVGQKIIQILFEEKLFYKTNIKLFVSQRNAGNNIEINNHIFNLHLLDNNILKQKFDIVFFCAGEEISKKWAEQISNNGAFVIDNSNAFRHKKNIPLIIPEINSELINKKTKLISNPNCSTIQLAIIINLFLKISDINQIIVSTYQSVSGAGKDALLDLENGTSKIIKEGIKNNLILKIGEIESNGFCTEENKIINELNKILEKDISIIANTVRVPIPYCHTESVYVKFKNKINLNEIYDVLNTNYIKIDTEISQPKIVNDTNFTHICRIRLINDKELLFFIVADNLRRGASYNAVKIAEYLINNYIIKI